MKYGVHVVLENYVMRQVDTCTPKTVYYFFPMVGGLDPNFPFICAIMNVDLDEKSV